MPNLKLMKIMLKIHAKIRFSKDERFTEILGGLCVEAKTFIDINIDHNFITNRR